MNQSSLLIERAINLKQIESETGMIVVELNH